MHNTLISTLNVKVKGQVVSSQLLKNYLVSVIKLHAKVNSNEIICFYQK